MAGNPPQDVTVEKVLSAPSDPWGGGEDRNGRPRSKMRTYKEVLFAGDSETREAYVPEHIDLTEGVTKGWFNDKTRNWTIADPNPPQGGGGGRSGAGDRFDRSPDHPVQMQRALHTASMALAPVLIEQMGTLTVIETPKSKDEYLKLVEGVAVWVQSTYPPAVLEQAAKAAAS